MPTTVLSMRVHPPASSGRGASAKGSRRGVRATAKALARASGLAIGLTLGCQSERAQPDSNEDARARRGTPGKKTRTPRLRGASWGMEPMSIDRPPCRSSRRCRHVEYKRRAPYPRCHAPFPPFQGQGLRHGGRFRRTDRTRVALAVRPSARASSKPFPLERGKGRAEARYGGSRRHDTNAGTIGSDERHDLDASNWPFSHERHARGASAVMKATTRAHSSRSRGVSASSMRWHAS